MASPPTDPFAALEAQITANVTVEQSAVTLINGIAAEITNAVNTALANGATAAQIATLVTNEVQSLTASASTLSAAILANTPSAPPTSSNPSSRSGKVTGS